MDTLYLVFKHQFQIVFGLHYRLKNFVSSKRGLYPNTRRLSSDLGYSCECYFPQTKTTVGPANFGRKIVTECRRPPPNLASSKATEAVKTRLLAHDVFKIPTHLFCFREARFLRPV